MYKNNFKKHTLFRMMGFVFFATGLGIAFWVLITAVSASATAPSATFLKQDHTFGNNGIVYPGFSTDPYYGSQILQTDSGKIILADTFMANGMGQGDFGLAQYSKDGQLDSSFGADGIASYATDSDTVYAAALQADNKILVAGTTFKNGIYRMQLVRFLANGVVDTTFGTNGVVHVSEGDCTEATAIAVQPDNKILLAGCISGDLSIFRFNADGTIDSDFGNDGVLTVEFAFATAVDMVLQSDGKIVLAGQDRFLFRTYLIRVTTDGQLDNTFGTNGIVNIQASEEDIIMDATIQDDDKVILVGGGHSHSDGPGVLLLRFNTDGTLDNTFGINGVVVTSLITEFFEWGRAIMLKPDGRLLVAGSISGAEQDYERSNIILIQYLSDGNLDTSFGNAGHAILSLSNDEEERPAAVSVLDDGKLLLLGNLNRRLFLTRLSVLPLEGQIYLPLIKGEDLFR